MEQDFGQRLNTWRGTFGLPSLFTHPTVGAVAQAHAEDLARRKVISHGSGPGNMDVAADRLAAAGYAWGFAAENTAFGQRDVGAVLLAWQTSDGHRENMLTDKAVHFGFGAARNRIGPYWVLVLAAPLGMGSR